VGGAKGGANAPGEAWPPSPLAALAARRRASSQRRAVARRAIWLSAWTFARPRHTLRRQKAALCAAGKARAKTPERAGATPPPAPLRGPGSDPGGGRSCPILLLAATVSRRQTSRQTARGGLSTAMRPVVALVVVAFCRCLSDRSAIEEMPQSARVAVQLGPETRATTMRRSGYRMGIHASDRSAAT
jgi:hypothetical protein